MLGMRSSRRDRDLRSRNERRIRHEVDLPLYRSRTGAHCARRTTFTLRDLAGWYACLACGRYA